jgi:FG-GAP-like repeat
MVCIALNGDTYVHINAGKLGFIDGGLWKPNEGSPQDRVRLADIDGDGRADYCTIADNGDINCWWNGGQGTFDLYILHERDVRAAADQSLGDHPEYRVGHHIHWERIW